MDFFDQDFSAANKTPSAPTAEQWKPANHFPSYRGVPRTLNAAVHDWLTAPAPEG